VVILSAPAKIHATRIEACLEVWSYILKYNVRSREKIRRRLEETYNKYSVEPIRGRTKINIFDKEMITLYLVGKYGLGLDESEIPNKAFSKEIKIEKTVDSILKGENVEKVIKKHFRRVDENIIFRILRFVLTKILLGWEDEDALIKVFSLFEKKFTKYEKNFKSFVRFYVALRIAEKIVKKEVQNRLEKEALKHSLCLKFNMPKNAPSDNFIREIAVNVFKGEEHEVNTVLAFPGPQSLEIKL